MELSEFEAVVSELDARIASARERTEKKARREAIEKRLREVVHRQSAVESRVAELKRLGEGAGENVLAFSARLKAEAEAVRAELVAEFPEAAQQAVPEAAATQPPPLDDGERAKVLDLMAEIDESKLKDIPQDEVNLVIEYWATRWRILADAFGNDRVRLDRNMQRCYGWLSGARERNAPGLFVHAMDKNVKKDWVALLVKIETALKGVHEEQERQKETARKQDENLREIQALVEKLPHGTGEAESDDWRTIKHLIRETAKTPERRPDLAQLCRPLRNALEPEFSFLWAEENGDDDEDDVPGRHLTNREILGRLMRRMVRKGAIGGRTAPTDMISKGMPPHQMGEAKAAFDLLVKAGIVKLAKQGDVVSIDPDLCKAAKALADGAACGIEFIDKWAETA